MKLEPTGKISSDLYIWKERYIEHIVVLGYSKETIKIYDYSLVALLNYTFAQKIYRKIIDINLSFFTKFIIQLENNARRRGVKKKEYGYLSYSTKETYFKAVRNLFVFIGNNNSEMVTFDRYYKGVVFKKHVIKCNQKKYLTSEEVSRIVSFLNFKIEDTNNFFAYRNSFLVKLMLFAGLRISEALQFSTDSILSSEGRVVSFEIIGKGGNIEIVNIKKSHISKELSFFKKYSFSHEKIFTTSTGNSLSRTQAYSLINRIYRQVGISKTGLHILRHTTAMMLLQKRVDLLTIKKILRHKNITTTTIYAEATQRNVICALCK